MASKNKEFGCITTMCNVSTDIDWPIGQIGKLNPINLKQPATVELNLIFDDIKDAIRFADLAQNNELGGTSESVEVARLKEENKRLQDIIDALRIIKR